MTRTRNLLLATTALAVTLTACSSRASGTNGASGTNSGSAAAAAPEATAFVLREWSITPPTAPLLAGKVTITATNMGSEAHELVILRASAAAALPTKSDGSVDEENLREADKAGRISGLAAGQSASKSVDLAAGEYVALCNLVDAMGQSGGGMSGMSGMGGGGAESGAGTGHVHYRLGMVSRFTVA